MRPYRYGRKTRPQPIIPAPSKPRHTEAALRTAEELSKSVGTWDKLPAAAVIDGQEWNGPAQWLIDSGSAVDLVAADDVSPAWLDEVQTLQRPVKLATANGLMKVNKQVPMQVGVLLTEVTPLLLPNTPPVLSLGKRCMEEGYGFYWRPGQQPILVTPAGKKISLEVNDNVPYLSDGPEQLLAMPAASSSDPPPPSGAPGRHGREAADEWWQDWDGMEDPPDWVVEFTELDAAERAQAREEAIEEVSDAESDGVSEALEAIDRDLVAEASSLKHLITHHPKNPHCPVCQRAKLTSRPCRRQRLDPADMPVEFGDLVTADHLLVSDLDPNHGSKRRCCHQMDVCLPPA